MNTEEGGAIGTVAQLIIDGLDAPQRQFIMKMQPHRESQRISAADWEAVEPCVRYDDEWPDTYWFGGMRLTWVRNRAQRTFTFNEVGLKVRALLAQGIKARSDETRSGSAVGESPVRASECDHPQSEPHND